MPRPPIKKSAIERAALELFVEKGIDGTSIRDIARRAEVTEGALYRHHASKDALVVALFAHYFTSYGDMLKDAAAEGEGLGETLETMVRGFYQAYDEDPKAFLFVMNVRHNLLEKVRAEVLSPATVLQDVLSAAAERGEIPRQNIALAVQMIMGLVIQVAVGHRYHRLTGKLAPLSAQVSRACVAVLGSG